MNAKVFLDSGIFVAFLNSRDHWHERAVQLFGGPTPKWVTSILVVSETYSWFLHRLGEEPARRFHLLIQNLEGLTLLPAATEHHEEARKTLDRFRGSKLTYVDASSLALMSRHRITTVWSTDHHLGLAGAEVLPKG